MPTRADLVPAGAASGPTLTLPFNSTASAGDLLVLGVSSDDVSTVTSTGWTKQVIDESSLGAYIFWKKAAGGETSVVQSSATGPRAAIFARYTGMGSSPFDASAAAHNTSTAASTPASGTGSSPLVPAAAGKLIVAFACLGNLSANPTGFSSTGGYSVAQTEPSVTSGFAAQSQFIAMLEKISGTTSEWPVASWTTSTGNQTLVIASFTPAANTGFGGGFFD